MAWRITGADRVFKFRLYNGLSISIRPRPSGDYDTAYEIFFLKIYQLPLDPLSVRYIVDLGGNVGFSSMFWAAAYSKVEVLTFEPHPQHCALLKSHLEANGLADRVRLIEAAATVRAETAYLTDCDDASSLVRSGADGNIKVKALDIFEAVGSRPIDVLKIDIEGSEYPILADERFHVLAARVRCIILEWHHRAPGHFGPEWCAERLLQNGFDVTNGRSCEKFGILYAMRPQPLAA